MTEKHLWWKILGVVLLFWVLYRGLLTPIKHGVSEIHPDRFHSGNRVSLMIRGYNSHYDIAGDETRVFFRHQPSGNEPEGNFLIQADSVAPRDPNHIEAWFNLPKFLPDTRKIALFSLLVDNPIDGATVLPGKVIIHQDSVNLNEGRALWNYGKQPDFHVIHKSHFPYRNILVETIRNTFFHVSLWFAMFFMLAMSVYCSFKFLKTHHADYDLRAFALVRTALVFGLMGCLTGSMWARFTWETWWTTDIKLNMAALTILIYLAYLVLRASIEDQDRKAQISAAYNIFALVAVVPLIFVLPRLTDSLHPGNGGNPAFGSDDMDNALRQVFYPAVLSFILIGLWMASLLYRYESLQSKLDERE